MAEELEDQINEEEEIQWVVDETTASEYINTFCYALATMEQLIVL